MKRRTPHDAITGGDTAADNASICPLFAPWRPVRRLRIMIEVILCRNNF